MKPTYDDLFEMVQLLSRANFELQQTNKRLQKRVDELEERLNLKSYKPINGFSSKKT